MQGFVQETYDRIASQYDDLWTPHVAEPEERLTAALRLRPGERLADLACGTGVHTVEMARLVHPGEVIGVDNSEEMLRAATARAGDEGLPLTTVCGDAEAVLGSWAPRSLDVLSMRFCLAYIDWRRILPSWAALLRDGGRIGILTNLSSSAPQAWQLYTEMQRELGLPLAEVNTPNTPEEVHALLEAGGLTVEESFGHRFRIYYRTGIDAVAWLRDSGFATHPAIAEVPKDAMRMLIEMFGGKLEQRFREDGGVPLDFQVAGIVARRR